MNEFTKRLWEIRNGLARTSAEVKKDEKKIKPIAPRSEKMKIKMIEYKPKVKAFLLLPENKKCAIKMKGCTGKAVCVHHTAGRTGDKLLDELDWVASCLNCNLAVELNDKDARDSGMKKTRLKNSTKRKKK